MFVFRDGTFIVVGVLSSISPSETTAARSVRLYLYHSLHLYYEEWCKAELANHFFYWCLSIFYELHVVVCNFAEEFIISEMITRMKGMCCTATS
ncbi:hypothetical protein ACET3Z_022408 [Daucus carota]